MKKNFSMKTSRLMLLCAVFLHVLIQECEAGCGKGRYANIRGYCFPCPIGTYNKHDHATSCQNCLHGWTTLETGRRYYWECRLSCGVGSYAHHIGRWSWEYECRKCPKGRYSTTYTAYSCTKCPSGQTTNGEGSAAKSACYTADCGRGNRGTADGCEPCPIGRYNSGVSVGACKWCRRGFTTNVPGRRYYWQCTRVCDEGYHSAKDGGWRLQQGCVICAQGTYNTNATAKSCTPCPNGQITAKEGSTSIDQCLAGRTCVNGCPPLSSLHGVVSYNRSAIGGRYPVGTKGTYHCDVSLYSGSETRTCQRSGVWGGSPAICTKTCQPLDDSRVGNGGYISYNMSSINGRYRIGTKADYHCSTSYIFPLPSYTGSRTCHWDGFWSGFVICQ